MSLLLAAWQLLPEGKRTARLKALRICAWYVMCQRADRLAVALQCCEAGCECTWQASDEIIRTMPTLTLRRLLVELARMQP